jgi:hypothetical protein
MGRFFRFVDQFVRFSVFNRKLNFQNFGEENSKPFDFPKNRWFSQKIEWFFQKYQQSCILLKQQFLIELTQSLATEVLGSQPLAAELFLRWFQAKRRSVPSWKKINVEKSNKHLTKHGNMCFSLVGSQAEK